MWHMTGDSWQLTCDAWHATRDTWYIVWDEYSLKTLAPKLFWFGIESDWKIFWLKDRSVNQSIKDGGDCRTAPSTPGLLNMLGCLVSYSDCTGHLFFFLQSIFQKHISRPKTKTSFRHIPSCLGETPFGQCHPLSTDKFCDGSLWNSWTRESSHEIGKTIKPIESLHWFVYQLKHYTWEKCITNLLLKE